MIYLRSQSWAGAALIFRFDYQAQALKVFWEFRADRSYVVLGGTCVQGGSHKKRKKGVKMKKEGLIQGLASGSTLQS